MRFICLFSKKNKKISPHKRSSSQIMSRAQNKEDEDEISALPFNSKTQATLREKIFITNYGIFDYTCRMEGYKNLRSLHF